MIAHKVQSAATADCTRVQTVTLIVNLCARKMKLGGVPWAMLTIASRSGWADISCIGTINVCRVLFFFFSQPSHSFSLLLNSFLVASRRWIWKHDDVYKWQYRLLCGIAEIASIVIHVSICFITLRYCCDLLWLMQQSYFLALYCSKFIYSSR